MKKLKALMLGVAASQTAKDIGESVGGACKEAGANAGEAGSWERFRADHADLFVWPSPVLDRHYSPGALGSPEARVRFVPPDRAPLP